MWSVRQVLGSRHADHHDEETHTASWHTLAERTGSELTAQSRTLRGRQEEAKLITKKLHGAGQDTCSFFAKKDLTRQSKRTQFVDKSQSRLSDFEIVPDGSHMIEDDESFIFRAGQHAIILLHEQSSITLI